MAKSAHAAAAAMIRKEMKKNGIKGSVRSSSYSGGSSITVRVNDLTPWTLEALTRFVSGFQYGHFDGMYDIYEYSNSRDDIPQVRFTFVECSYSDELRQKAYEYLRAVWAGYENHPESYKDAANLRGDCRWVSDEVYQVLNGSWFTSCSNDFPQFWNKPRVRLAA